MCQTLSVAVYKQISDTDLDNALLDVNTSFSDAFMEFFLCDGINYINDDKLCDYNSGDQSHLTETNNVSGLINIYFIDYIENTAKQSICGYSDNTKGNDVIVIKTSCATNGSSLAHELGHFFSLLHTHGIGDMTTELVDGSNCDTDGDGICDTPADPKLTSKTINNFCEYTGNEVDANGDHYTPDTKNIMSYALKGCRTHFTPEQLARMYAYYKTTKSYLSCPSFNADVHADVSQTCEETLTVNLSNLSTHAATWEWDIDSDGIADYKNQNPIHTFKKGIYDITLKVSDKSKTITKTFFNFIKVGTPSGYLNEDFETSELIDDNGWTVVDTSNNGYQWHINSGGTPSENTGPKIDNTYVYAEASEGHVGDITEFISPCIAIVNDNTDLSFSYHMFGKNIGELHVDIKTDSGYINDAIDPIYGNQQETQNEGFITKIIDLSAYTNQTIKVRFRAIRGDGWLGDIAIDNIFVRTIDTALSDNTVKVYPNPITSATICIKIDNQHEETANFSIRNMFGQTFLSGIIDKNAPINVSNLPSGTYLLTVSSATSTAVKKIVK